MSRALVLAAFVAAVSIAAPVRDFDLVVALPQRNLESFEKLFWEISTPGNPKYLQHLSREEVASHIGASDDDVASVQQWLTALGARPGTIRVAPLRDTVSATFDAQAPQRSAHFGYGARRLPHASSQPAAAQFVLRRDALTPEKLAALDSARAHASLGAAAGSNYNINSIKQAYGIDTDLAVTNDETLQMVWGPGTFGYSPSGLKLFRAEQCKGINVDKVKFDTENQGRSGGDNFGEGTLDVHMISSFGMNASTLVSNTNTSASTEEGEGFGQALLDFLLELPNRQTLPQVLSMSLGSLSGASCDLLCERAVALGHTAQECHDYMQQQRQVCMYLSQDQTSRISTALQVLGARGVSVFGSSGDGGSHFSFGSFSGGAIAETLNTISCNYSIPVFPTASPYVLSIGGEQWGRGGSSDPETWAGFGGGSGGGFSWQFDMPDHQKKSGAVDAYLQNTAGVPGPGHYNGAGRAYPDMAAVGVDGTSQSCPITAGIWSLVTDARLNAGLKPLGFLGPRVWQVAQQFPGEAFEDITVGNSKTSCDDGFPAAKGWDPNTGWGRPVFAGMLKHFASDTHL